MLKTKPNTPPAIYEFDTPGQFAPEDRINLLQAFAMAGDYDIGRVSTAVMPSGINPHYNVRWSNGDRDFVQSITGVVIHVQPTRVFWGRPYEDSNGEPPLCTSDNAMIGIGNPGGDCYQCPHARNFECSETHFVFIMPEGEHHPLAIRVTPGSLNNWQQFSAYLRQSMMDWGRPLDDIRDPLSAVATRFELEESTKKKGAEHMRVKPTVAGLLSPPDQALYKDIQRALLPHLGKAAYTPNMLTTGQVIQSEHALDNAVQKRSDEASAFEDPFVHAGEEAFDLPF